MAEETPPFPYTLGPKAYRDLSELVKFAKQLNEIDKSARDMGPAESPSAVLRRIASQISIPSSTLESITTALTNLRHAKDRLHITSEELFDIASKYLEESAPTNWKENFFSDWTKRRDNIISAIDFLSPDHPISLSAKAEALTYTQQNLLMDSSIITDLRPIFNNSGDKIVESVITHTLVITYVDGERTQDIHLSMDAKDIGQLRRICDRADKKAITLKSNLETLPWPTTIIRGALDD